MNSTLINANNGSPVCVDHLSTNEPTSIHSALIDEIYDIPMKEIIRPLLSVLDENKVESMMETIQVNLNQRFIFFIE